MSDDAANGEEIYAKATKKLKVRIGTLRSRSACPRCRCAAATTRGSRPAATTGLQSGSCARASCDAAPWVAKASFRMLPNGARGEKKGTERCATGNNHKVKDPSPALGLQEGGIELYSFTKLRCQLIF